jgi:uncharacterized coiled-coil DUF342 family protein|tara:strand:+ start:1043 stop:1411 length:369 start_codon:yes stop_codon:yes gene_type:complete
MAEKKQLYVAIDPNEYKTNKTNILRTKADVISIIKHLQELKKIKTEESQLKNRLHQLFDSVKKTLKQLENKIPTPSIPKSIKQSLEALETPEVSETPLTPKQDSSIDRELQEIKRKLSELNS